MCYTNTSIAIHECKSARILPNKMLMTKNESENHPDMLVFFAFPIERPNVICIQEQEIKCQRPIDI